ncbi:Receptor-interacting serine/threonine-protein kinase 4 [Chionoecetes opilio]|uniref:Receptor-interacting serine/threonine-protein kinase 4 n=1 Tax=Chionoecetes opilio TaxID=41210 RepID=A0A8J4YAC4_CHIOP|nr:Receptor-interacting serine/threonine-protein kinase 4 [Chionoecetes opilio]
MIRVSFFHQENKKPKDLSPWAAPSPDLPLLNFAFMGRLDKVKRELDEEGTSVNMSDPKDGRTALHVACLAGHEGIVSTLLSYDANTHARDHSGKRPLHMAAEEGHHHLLPLLLARCLMEARDNKGLRALHLAAQRGHLTFLKVLEENGAHLSAVCGIENSTSLHLAAEEGHVEVVRWLVEQGVSIYIRDTNRLTAEDRARARQHLPVVKYLETISVGEDHEDLPKGDAKARAKVKLKVFNERPEVPKKPPLTLKPSTPQVKPQWLLEAAGDGDVGLVRQLLAEGVWVEARGRSGEEEGACQAFGRSHLPYNSTTTNPN